MKTLLLSLLFLFAVTCLVSEAKQEKPKPGLTKVQLRGAVESLTVATVAAGENGKVVTKFVSVLNVSLANKVVVAVQLPKALGNEVITLVEKGVIVEGVLKAKGNQMILVAERWSPADGEAAKNLAAGMASLEGKAVQGTYSYGKAQKSSLAIENGASQIIVGGALTKEQTEIEGMIRVQGKLGVDDKGLIFVIGDKVEKVQAK